MNYKKSLKRLMLLFTVVFLFWAVTSCTSPQPNDEQSDVTQTNVAQSNPPSSQKETVVGTEEMLPDESTPTEETRPEPSHNQDPIELPIIP